MPLVRKKNSSAFVAVTRDRAIIMCYARCCESCKTDNTPACGQQHKIIIIYVHRNGIILISLRFRAPSIRHWRVHAGLVSSAVECPDNSLKQAWGGHWRSVRWGWLTQTHRTPDTSNIQPRKQGQTQLQKNRGQGNREEKETNEITNTPDERDHKHT